MNDIFKALSDSTRRDILILLVQGECSVNEIAMKFEMSRPAISKHLKILEHHNLLAIKSDGQDGRQRICYAQLEAMNEVEEYLEQLRKFWSKKLDGLGAFLDED